MPERNEDFIVPIPTRMTISPPAPVYLTGTSGRFTKVPPNTTVLITAEGVRGILSVVITGSTLRNWNSTASGIYEAKIFVVPAGVTVQTPPPYNSTDYLFCQWKDFFGNIQINQPMPGMYAKVYFYVKCLSTTETLFVSIGFEK